MKYSKDDKITHEKLQNILLGGRVHDNGSKRYKYLNTAAYMVARIY